MEIIRCDKGHFYDADICSYCPTCAKESGSAFPGVDEPGSTVPVFTPPAPPVSPRKPEPTEFVFDAPKPEPAAPAAPAASNGIEDYGTTVPAGYNDLSAKPTPAAAPAGKPAPAANGIEEYGNTVPAGYADFMPGAAGAAQSVVQPQPQSQMFNPVVGWLVCVEGPNKGADYRIHSQYNYIGRAKHMDICIPGDQYISAERAAIIAYDNQEKFFSFGPGFGHNIVRLNNQMVMGQQILKAYDTISIGSSKLLFVPLCGDQFDWDK